jgi:hypothetical protein
MIDKVRLLLRADQCKRFADRCIDRDVAAQFIELARHYESLAGEAETEPHGTDLVRPCRNPAAQHDQAPRLVRSDVRSVSKLSEPAMRVGKNERSVFRLLGFAFIILPWVCAVLIVIRVFQ